MRLLHVTVCDWTEVMAIDFWRRTVVTSHKDC